MGGVVVVVGMVVVVVLATMVVMDDVMVMVVLLLLRWGRTFEGLLRRGLVEHMVWRRGRGKLLLRR